MSNAAWTMDHRSLWVKLRSGVSPRQQWCGGRIHHRSCGTYCCCRTISENCVEPWFPILVGVSTSSHDHRLERIRWSSKLWHTWYDIRCVHAESNGPRLSQRVLSSLPQGSCTTAMCVLQHPVRARATNRMNVTIPNFMPGRRIFMDSCSRWNKGAASGTRGACYE